MKLSRVVNTVNVEGSSPPSVFVGRIGYPKVLAGPATPPEHGNTSLYDLPELWLDIPLESIVAFRGSLIVARRPVNVYDVESRYVQTLQELVLSVDPVDIEITLRKPPRAEISLSDFEPPIGPRAPVKDFYIVSYRATHRVIEKVYSDTDLSAREAVVKLYESSIPVTHIQKLFSVGALGKKRSRRLVPTRYAITAVDAILSDHLLKRVRELPELDSVLLFTRSIHNNLFAAILIPGKWSFEWMEAWFPGSTWNPYGKEIVIEGDYELYKGRKSYPSIGGCYYASRLATAEYMLRIGRQGIAILLREIYEGFTIPIGVWFVRENVRAMYRSKPLKFDSVHEALLELAKISRVGISKWIQSSQLLRKVLFERKLIY